MPSILADRVRDLIARACCCTTCHHLTLDNWGSERWRSKLWAPAFSDPTFDERKLLLAYCPELRGQPIGPTNGGPHECPPEDYDG